MAHPLRLPHRYRLDQNLFKSGTAMAMHTCGMYNGRQAVMSMKTLGAIAVPGGHRHVNLWVRIRVRLQ